ncbi:sensor histidine kinase [Rhizobium leguminosarum]|uniref:sensor histidine kinase n=1 Tax=Rhizobium leguminosarum TaxID=384 RepID=UPI0010317DDB|nr:ATP-binding protein [Rhizobium leguminosarum]TAY31814.1 sensor histidine kinase [Rhizobium leguminosarum]
MDSNVDTTDVRAPAGGISLARQFVLAAAGVLLFGMSAIGFWVSGRIEDSLIHNAAAATALYVDSIIAPLTQELAKSNTLGEGARVALTETLSQGVLSEKLFAFKIWKPDGTIVFSNEDGAIGKRFEMTDGLRAAKAGQIHAEFDQLEGPENEVERHSGIPLLEIYSPIREPWSGDIIGIAEFYENGVDLRSELTRARLQSWLVVGVVTLAMLALLFGIVARGSRLITRQRAALDEKVETLSTLLSQNQALRRRADQATHRTADLNERYLRRISAELHDGPAQSLAFASLRLRSILPAGSSDQDSERVKAALDDAMRDIRNICRGLTLPELDGLGVDDVLKRVVAAHESRTGTRVAFACDPVLPDLSKAEKICAYRFVQETLNNAARHAAGIGQEVTASAAGSGIEITVSDKGPGFDRGTAGEGLGLLGLEERIAGLGGTLDLNSQNGTRLTMRLPGNTIQ